MNWSRKWIAVMSAVVLLGATLAITTSPVGAAAGLNVNKIWKQIKPKADKRYYKKSKVNKKFAKKKHVYTKAESDAAFAGAGTSYTKAESDEAYAPAKKLIRGTSSLVYTAAGVGSSGGASISFGETLSAAPITHIIPLGDPLPVGCSGTPAAPNAAAGHLCVFVNASVGPAGPVEVFTPIGGFGANALGAVMINRAVGAGEVILTTSWAVRPISILSPTAKVPAGRGGNFRP